MYARHSGRPSRFALAHPPRCRQWLVGTALKRASLGYANLARVNLIGANLTGANLDGSKGLTQQQLNITRGDAKTILPPNFMPGICNQQHTPE
jgi:hypothetical protein